jgi:hypothetical protein
MIASPDAFAEARLNNYLVPERSRLVTHSVPEFLPAAPQAASKFLASFPTDATFVRYIQPAFFALRPRLALPYFPIVLAILVPSLLPTIAVSCGSPLVRARHSTPSPQRVS